MSGVKIFRL